MKRYKLLKDLPFAKAGTVFMRNTFKSKDGLSDYDYLETSILLDGNQDETVFGIKRNYFVNNFDEWFEEIPKYYFSINEFRKEVQKVIVKYHPNWVIENLKSIGLLFETEEEAEDYLDYLNAKETIRKDTKGFKPDWNNSNEAKYYGVWNFDREKTEYFAWDVYKSSDIFFKSIEDIEESFEKHPDEWKTYLTYEQ